MLLSMGKKQTLINRCFQHPASFTASLNHPRLLGMIVPSASRILPEKNFTWFSM